MSLRDTQPVMTRICTCACRVCQAECVVVLWLISHCRAALSLSIWAARRRDCAESACAGGRRSGERKKLWACSHHRHRHVNQTTTCIASELG
eukprot:COSAG01_NODE_5005_length_4551_cov_80.702381_1_plen_92_part_00